jgi:hypothetical protein
MKMESITYLAIAYLGMIFALGIWTYIVATRHRRMMLQIQSIEEALSHQITVKEDSENE